VHWAAASANGAGLALALAFGALTGWRELEGPSLAALFLAGVIGMMLPADGPRTRDREVSLMVPTPNSEQIVRLRVRLADAPPRACAGYVEIEGGLQRKDDVLPGDVGPDGLPRFTCELRARRDATTGAPVFLGPCAFGPPAERFLYVSWSAVRLGDPDDGRAMFRRAKVPLGGITWAQVEDVAARPDGVLEATVPGVARDGGPVCASVPPRDGWRVVAG